MLAPSSESFLLAAPRRLVPQRVLGHWRHPRLRGQRQGGDEQMQRGEPQSCKDFKKYLIER